MPPFSMPLLFSIYMVIYLLFAVMNRMADHKRPEWADLGLLVLGIITVTLQFAK